jgi:hypothetical protein
VSSAAWGAAAHVAVRASLPGVEPRHEPERSRVVVHHDGRDIAYVITAEVEHWSVEPA